MKAFIIALTLLAAPLLAGAGINAAIQAHQRSVERAADRGAHPWANPPACPAAAPAYSRVLAVRPLLDRPHSSHEDLDRVLDAMIAYESAAAACR